jgi:hypothetical protein
MQPAMRIICAVSISAVLCARAAGQCNDKYWQGQPGDEWSRTDIWAPLQQVPTATDNVIFDFGVVGPSYMDLPDTFNCGRQICSFTVAAPDPLPSAARLELGPASNPDDQVNGHARLYIKGDLIREAGEPDPPLNDYTIRLGQLDSVYVGEGA